MFCTLALFAFDGAAEEAGLKGSRQTVPAQVLVLWQHPAPTQDLSAARSQADKKSAAQTEAVKPGFPVHCGLQTEGAQSSQKVKARGLKGQFQAQSTSCTRMQPPAFSGRSAPPEARDPAGSGAHDTTPMEAAAWLLRKKITRAPSTCPFCKQKRMSGLLETNSWLHWRCKRNACGKRVSFLRFSKFAGLSVQPQDREQTGAVRFYASLV